MKNITRTRAIASAVLACAIMAGVLAIPATAPAAPGAQSEPAAAMFRSAATDFLGRAAYLRYAGMSGVDEVLADANVRSAEKLLKDTEALAASMRSSLPGMPARMRAAFAPLVKSADELAVQGRSCLRLRQDEAAALTSGVADASLLASLGLLQDATPAAAESRLRMDMMMFKSDLSAAMLRAF